MKKGWVLKKLGDTEILKIVDGDRGKNYPKQSDFLDEGYCLFLNTKNVRPDGFNFDIKIFIDKEKDNALRKGKLLRRDVILTTRGTIGNIAIYDDNVEFDHIRINSGMLILRPNESIITSEYLFKILLSPALKTQISKDTSGAAQPQLPIKTLVNFTIPIPPLSEQKQIVLIVDEAFEGIDRAIANTKKNLTNARELFESYLNNIFTRKGNGWAKRTLKEVSSDFGRGKSKHRPRNDPKLYGGSYPFIQTGDVRNCDHLITDSSQFYSEMGLMQSKLWPKGTICITIAANIAETGILDFDACFPDSIIGIVVNEQLTISSFVKYLLQSVKTSLKAKGKGSAQDNINLATFENERFPFPSLREQKLIVERLNLLSSEIQSLEYIYEKKLLILNELKQSILQKAFAGELTADSVSQTKKVVQEAIKA